MTLHATPYALRVAEGSAFDRGQAQAALYPGLGARVAEATVARVDGARAEGWFTAEAEAYLAAQRGFHAAADPEGLAELAGIAAGFGLAEPDLFRHLHLGTLRDLRGGARLLDDGCSAWAVGQGPDGPLVVKNRDYTGTHRGIQCLIWHAGPDIETGGMVCLGSLGSPGAYSSGMNRAGLAIADTQIGARTHAIGWLRYFLITRLLAQCATVADALAFLQAVPHAGGGSLVMADRTGATAAVELGAAYVVVETGPLSLRTNHFLGAALAEDTLSPVGERIGGTSMARHAFLASRLPTQPWRIADAAALMASHAADGAPVCQHPEAGEETATLSSVVYAIAEGAVYWVEGNPCAGRWRRAVLPG